MAAADWTDAFLDEMSTIGDPIADATVQSLYTQGQIDEVNSLVHALVRADDVPAEALPQVANAYFAETADFPPWVDWDLVHEGQRVFSRFGPMAVLALHCASLPECYAAADGAQILHFSGGMSGNPSRRILETAQFVIDVMAPGGLGPDGAGVRSIQKVRLFHAAIRFLMPRHPDWDPKWGVPINQEDQAGTLMAFSWIVLRSLKTVGIDFEPSEQRAYLHAWRVVGYLLGLREELLTDEPLEARDLVAQIRRRHHRVSTVGRALNNGLIEQMGEWIPGRFGDGIAVTMMRHWLDDEVVEVLGIPKAGWTRHLVGAISWLNHVLDSAADESAPVRRITQMLGRRLVNGLHELYRGGERTDFALPETLRAGWGVK
jgi:hypothetical protein